MKHSSVAAAVMAATSVLTSGSVAMAAVSGPAPAGFPTPAPAWRDCHTDNTAPQLECATITVPLDWSQPGGQRITLALNRLRATDSAHRIGSLLLNPGGPGGSGTAVVAQGGMLLGTPQLKPLRERFDLIGFDPRGVGDSTPVRCSTPVYDPAAPTLPTTAAEYRRLTESNRRHGNDCLKTTGPLLRHVDTVSAAHDVDAIRAALGESRISWLGVSYGTELGSAYARLFPGRVRTMVLDGAVDHARSVARGAVDESTAMERGLHRFTSWCQATADCPLHGRDVMADFDALTARADKGEVTDPALGRPLTAAEVTSGTYGHLIIKSLWPQLATALADAEKRPSDATALGEGVPGIDPTYTSYRAVGCHDFPPRVRGFEDVRARLARAKEAAPHMWRYSEMWDMTTGCSGWPVPAANPPRPERITGAPVILVVGNTYDPSTPYVWAQALTRQIDGACVILGSGQRRLGGCFDSRVIPRT